jgi:FkbM family methyltransferase
VNIGMDGGDWWRVREFFGKLRNIAHLLRFCASLVTERTGSRKCVAWVENTFLSVRGFFHGTDIRLYLLLYESVDIAFTAHFLRAGDVFGDVGANIGTYAIVASGVCGSKTFAFEPDPHSADLLRSAISKNRLEELVVVKQVALGPQAGEANFTVGLDTRNRVAVVSETNIRTVEMETLDQAMSDDPPTMLKIDVEGFEAEVLQGALNLLQSPGLKAVIVECRSVAVISCLHAAGFQEYSYDPYSRELSPAGFHARINALFLRDLEFSKKRVRESRTVRLWRRLI